MKTVGFGPVRGLSRKKEHARGMASRRMVGQVGVDRIPLDLRIPGIINVYITHLLHP